MLRRKFIKDSLLGVPVLLMAPSLLAACNKNEVNPGDKKVIVIGAGISGLTAAKILKEKGFKVTVLESSAKLGGRLSTNRTLGFAFDEGASWIHGINGNPITGLAQQAGMQTAFTDDESMKSYDLGGAVHNATTFANTEQDFYNVLNSMMASGDPALSFETVFNSLYPAQANNRLWKFFISTYLTFDTGDLNNLSSTLYNEGEEFSGPEHMAVNGYDTIATYLANGLDIRLSSKVSGINYSGNKVKVTYNGGEEEGDYVIVTVPLGVLKANTIQFTPALPAAKQTAIQKVGMSCVNKFMLTWNTVFWDNTQYISYTPNVADKFNYFVNINKLNPSANALMTFAYAGYARQTETMSDAQVTDEIMLHLKDMYGNSIPYPTNMLRTRWQANNNCFGSYSYTAVGTEMRHFDDLAEEINDKVFFAGEHTEADYFSTVHGAYLSGAREAVKIINLL